MNRYINILFSIIRLSTTLFTVKDPEIIIEFYRSICRTMPGDFLCRIQSTFVRSFVGLVKHRTSLSSNSSTSQTSCVADFIQVRISTVKIRILT